ncbi:GNAT family N-acetyltransferase [Maritalea porphyrae]|uniref:N-acetyltransferase n=1 Tax=Maritalea porphyrae TaxID=880732 RepID=A0ABQ5UKM6_9HYPH|nr:N-acetyltransferase [Maritalea porphyrae]
MADIEIKKFDGPSRGRYVAVVDGVEAELTYSRMSAHSIIADHTGVPEALKGKGVGKALVEYLIADARATDTKIVPLCPFVKAQYQRHPEWSDVIK